MEEFLYNNSQVTFLYKTSFIVNKNHDISTNLFHFSANVMTNFG